MSEKVDLLVIAVRRTSLKQQTEGGGERTCVHCEQKVWASPSSVKLQEKHPNWAYACTHCMFGPTAKGMLRVEPLSQAQQAEIEEFQRCHPE